MNTKMTLRQMTALAASYTGSPVSTLLKEMLEYIEELEQAIDADDNARNGVIE
jgi:hypothetical protein